jgi:RNA polymerase sigma-70 factor, ECF subfamily
MASSGTADDSLRIRQVLDGDVNAFEGLVHAHEGSVLRILRRHLPPDAVPDVAQEVFVKAYQSLPDFRGRSPFRSWLSGIAVRTCYDYWRTRYRSREIGESTLSADGRDWLERTAAAGAGEEFAESQRRRDAREALDWALSHLSAEDRMVLELVHLEGHSTKEAAKLLGWSTANVKVRAFRARGKLRKLLEREIGGPDG